MFKDFLGRFFRLDVEPVYIFEGFEPGSLIFRQSPGVFLYKLDCVFERGFAGEVVNDFSVADGEACLVA